MGMRGLLSIAVFLMFMLSVPVAEAQDSILDDPFVVTVPTVPSAMGDVSDEAQCFNVINRAPYSVFGSIHTNYYVRPDGVKTRHKSNFRLQPSEKAEFCTYGPFYDGQKVELVLRTLVPIFDCKTAVTEDIIIYGRRKSEGGTETWATCL